LIDKIKPLQLKLNDLCHHKFSNPICSTVPPKT